MHWVHILYFLFEFIKNHLLTLGSFGISLSSANNQSITTLNRTRSLKSINHQEQIKLPQDYMTFHHDAAPLIYFSFTACSLSDFESLFSSSQLCQGHNKNVKLSVKCQLSFDPSCFCWYQHCLLLPFKWMKRSDLLTVHLVYCAHVDIHTWCEWIWVISLCVVFAYSQWSSWKSIPLFCVVPVQSQVAVQHGTPL